jgi:6-phosphogluconolactonase
MKLEIHDTKEAVAHALSQHLEGWCRDENFRSIALSGGSTPQVWFDVLAKDYTERLPWEELLVFWGDERCVPPGDPQSNYGMTRRHLLEKVPVEASNVFRIRGENPPGEEAKRYSKILSTALSPALGIPQFDLVVLGMGDDGHTASIFPHQMELWGSKAYCEVARHPESGQKRISLTGQIINNAKQVVFLVTGVNKAAALAQIRNRSLESVQLPAAHVAPSSGRLLWLLDTAAAGESAP